MNTLRITRMPDLPFYLEEPINQLRVNLSFCGDQVKTVMMTSSTPDEGKSFLTIQLWRMLAEHGAKVLLIDCDLRNSEMRSKYGIAGESIQGIAHYLSGKAELDDVIYQTNIKNGYTIPNPTAIANPTILLESTRFDKMVEDLKDEFEYIFIDTPPLGSVADAMTIATHCDGVLLAIRSGHTPRNMVYNALSLIERTGTPLLGVVLNRVEMKNKSNRYYSRYYGGYGYGEDKKSNARV